MSQFNFGSNLGAGTANSSGFSFGAPNKTATPAFGGLGGAVAPTQQTQPSGSITFGTPIASIAPTVQNTGLTFGSTPTLGATALNFGAAPVATAAASTSALNFATPTKPPQFGAAPTTQPTLNFGGGPVTPIASSAPPPQSTLSFGGAVGTAPIGLNFGGGPAPAPTVPSGFGATPALNFGAPTSNALGGLNFGTPTSNALGGLNFGTPAASSTGFTLATNTSTAPPGVPGVPGGVNFGTGLGGGTPAAPAPLNFKGFSTAVNVATTNPPPSAVGAIGLGGVDSSQLKTGTLTTGSKDTVAAKENNVPNEILQSIEQFKQFVKDQKSQSSDVSRGSTRPFAKVKEDIDLINNVLSDVGNDLQRNQQQADKLKHDSAKCLHNAEMAQRTNDTPPGLQFENTAPMKYFIELVNQFEQDLQALRAQIDVTDKHFQSLHEPKFLTSQELAVGMRRLHDTFVALAGRLHSVHTQVESQKEQYLNLRKYILKDPTNIFVKPPSKEDQALDVALKGLAANKSVYGPTPFSSFGSPFAMNLLAQQAATKPPPAYPATTTSLSTGILGMGTSHQLGASTSSIFGNTSSSSNFDSGFQLQPPPGNKKTKRNTYLF